MTPLHFVTLGDPGPPRSRGPRSPRRYFGSLRYSTSQFAVRPTSLPHSPVPGSAFQLFWIRRIQTKRMALHHFRVASFLLSQTVHSLCLRRGELLAAMWSTRYHLQVSRGRVWPRVTCLPAKREASNGAALHRSGTLAYMLDRVLFPCRDCVAQGVARSAGAHFVLSLFPRRRKSYQL